MTRRIPVFAHIARTNNLFTPTLLVLILLAGLSLAINPIHAATNTTIQFGNYRALIIGINNYEHLTDLETAINDATSVNQLLKNKYGFETELLIDPTRYEIVSALDKLRSELTQEDSLLIFYAGHGELDSMTQEGFWLPADAETDSQANWVDVSTISRTLRGSLAKHVLVIADSCFSGTLTRSAGVELKTGSDRLAELQRLAKKRSRKALTSGGEEPVLDGGGDGHSVFTRALLRHLEEANQPLHSSDLYVGLRKKVVAYADQTPVYGDIPKSGDEGGEFIFLPKGATIVVAPDDSKITIQTGKSRAVDTRPQVSDEAAIELAFWNSIKDSSDPGYFEAYMKKYPEGEFKILAETRYAALSRDAATANNSAGAASGANGGGAPSAALDPIPYIVMSSGALREKPSRKGNVLAKLEPGTEIEVVEKVDGRNYFLARYGGLSGFIYIKSVKPKSAYNNIERRQEQQRNEEQARKNAEKQDQNDAYQRYLDAERRKQFQIRRDRYRY